MEQHTFWVTEECFRKKNFFKFSFLKTRDCETKVKRDENFDFTGGFQKEPAKDTENKKSSLWNKPVTI